MDYTFTKIPNWLRYILAIPFGILSVIIVAILIFISNSLYSAPNSLWRYISNFLFANGINAIVFYYSLNMMLPKYQFIITTILCIITGIAYSILQGISLVMKTLTLEYIIAYILLLLSLILSCYLSYKDFYHKKETMD